MFFFILFLFLQLFRYVSVSKHFQDVNFIKWTCKPRFLMRTSWNRGRCGRGFQSLEARNLIG